MILPKSKTKQNNYHKLLFPSVSDLSKLAMLGLIQLALRNDSAHGKYDEITVKFPNVIYFYSHRNLHFSYKSVSAANPLNSL